MIPAVLTTAGLPVVDRIRVALLDGRPMVREGLRALLDREPDLDVTDVAGRLDEAVGMDVEPDVIICELVLREMRGASIVKTLRERYERAAILVLTTLAEANEVEAAFAAGANGYCVKDSSVDEVVEAIRKVHRGEEYVEPSLGAALARRSQRFDPGDPGALTVREQQVLRLLALGHTNAEIADQLSVSLRTAEAHRANLVQKLGVRTRAELVSCAISKSLL
jgi:two-component system response regulator NreC